MTTPLPEQMQRDGAIWLAALSWLRALDGWEVENNPKRTTDTLMAALAPELAPMQGEAKLWRNSAHHTPVVTLGTHGTWRVICDECSHDAQDYTYPCQVGKWRDIPPHVLVGNDTSLQETRSEHLAVLAEATVTLAELSTQLAAFAAERDTARAELAALQQRIEALCDRADADLSGDTCHRVWTANLRIALRDALAGAAPTGETR